MGHLNENRLHFLHDLLAPCGILLNTKSECPYSNNQAIIHPLAIILIAGLRALVSMIA